MFISQEAVLSYRYYRTEKAAYVYKTLDQYNLNFTLRGSWKHDDFNLLSDGASTLSDLDLAIEGISPESRSKLQATLQNHFTGDVRLRVSIHGADSLLKMNLQDSLVLKIAEFLSKSRTLLPTEQYYEYTVAKTALMLLRAFPNERYASIADRIGTKEAKQAYAVKVGIETSFTHKDATSLLATSKNSLIASFVRECISTTPSEAYKDRIRRQLLASSSIDRWLQEYLISKMDGTIN